MIGNHFQFQDFTEQLYSYSTQDRFFEVLQKHQQLEKIILTKHSLQLLRKQSAQCKRQIITTLGLSIAGVVVLNKYVNFGPGTGPFIVKACTSLGILLLPSSLMITSARNKMFEAKKKAFDESRPIFRKFQLTGDVCQTKEGIELVD